MFSVGKVTTNSQVAGFNWTQNRCMLSWKCKIPLYFAGQESSSAVSSSSTWIIPATFLRSLFPLSLAMPARRFATSVTFSVCKEILTFSLTLLSFRISDRLWVHDLSCPTWKSSQRFSAILDFQRASFRWALGMRPPEMQTIDNEQWQRALFVLVIYIVIDTSRVDNTCLTFSEQLKSHLAKETQKGRWKTSINSRMDWR